MIWRFPFHYNIAPSSGVRVANVSLDELAPVRQEERPCPKSRIPMVCRDIMGANRESNGDHGK